MPSVDATENATADDDEAAADGLTESARRAQHARLKAYLRELEAEHGPISERIIEQVRREWPDDPQPRRTA